ncbi:hypothetical protein K438DRAFT_1963036 [Mycena galopus ATCC 62051]|nr:hypothetical protein K438DRAFT_1963036 [Mycena galopus ATCC 62051]
MSDRPRRSTTGRRPGLVDASKKRRTAAQIKEEDERVTAAANAKRKAAEDTRSLAVQRVVAKEDQMAREDKEMRTHAVRPDEAQEVDVSENEEQMEEDDDLDRPPASAIDTDSDGMTLGTDAEFDELPDGDNDDDEDYVQAQSDNHNDEDGDTGNLQQLGSDNDGSDVDEAKLQAEFAAFMKARKSKKKKATTATTTGKGKAKAKEKGLLRAEIEISQVATASASKRKAAAPPSQIDPPPVTKRAKANESCTSSEGDYGRTFAQDEPEITLQAAQASKASGSAARSGGTAKMGIKLIAVTPVISAPKLREKTPRAKTQRRFLNLEGN